MSEEEEEDAYTDEYWSGSEEGYVRDSYREEFEPEPPYSVQYSLNQQKFYENEDAGCVEIFFKPPDHTRSSTQSRTHKTSHTPKSVIQFNSAYRQSANEIQLYAFSGKRSYIEWEKNMEDWFYYNNIKKEKRLAYAIGQLKGEAHKWWIQEQDDRWYYKKQTITTWEKLKTLLRNQYAPKHKNKVQTTAELPAKKVISATETRSGKSVTKKTDHDKETVINNNSKLIEAIMARMEQIMDNQLATFRPEYSRTRQRKEQERIPRNKEQQKQASAQTDMEMSTQSELRSPLLEPQGKHTSDKSSNTLKLLEKTCFKCKNSGHYARECPTKRKTDPTFLALQKNSVDENDGSVNVLNALSSSIMHLSRSKGNDAGSKVGEEHLDKDLDIQKQLVEQGGELSLITNQRQISNPTITDSSNAEQAKVSDQLNRTVFNSSHDVITLLSCPKKAEKGTGEKKKHPETHIPLMCPDKAYEQPALEPPAQFDLASTEIIITAESTQHLLLSTRLRETQNLIPYWQNFMTGHSFKYSVFKFSTSSIMHLFCPMSVQKRTGSMENQRYMVEVTSKRSIFEVQPQNQNDFKEVEGALNTLAVKEKPPDLQQPQPIRIGPKEGTMSGIGDVTRGNTALIHSQGEELTCYIQIKEKPPDICQQTLKQRTRGNYLDSQKRMKPNLLSVGTGSTVLKTKLYETREYDAATNPSNYQTQEPKIRRTTMVYYNEHGNVFQASAMIKDKPPDALLVLKSNYNHQQGKLLNQPPESWYTFSCYDAGYGEHKDATKLEQYHSIRVPTDLEKSLCNGWTPAIIIRARDKELEFAKLSIFVFKNPFILDHTDVICLFLSKELNTGTRTALKRRRRTKRREEDKRFKPPDLDQDKHQDIICFKEAPPDATHKPKFILNRFGGNSLILHDSVIANLFYVHADKTDLRSNLSQVGGDDMIMDKQLEQKEEDDVILDGLEHTRILDSTSDSSSLELEPTEEDIMHVPAGAMTRSRTKLFKEAIGGLPYHIWREPLPLDSVEEVYQTSMVLVKVQGDQ